MKINGNNIRLLMKRYNVGLWEICGYTDIKPSRLCDIMNNKITPFDYEVFRFCTYFGVGINSLTLNIIDTLHEKEQEEK